MIINYIKRLTEHCKALGQLRFIEDPSDRINDLRMIEWCFFFFRNRVKHW